MEKPHILLVDDHPLNRFMVETILQKWNYQIFVASNGVEALEKIAQQDFDLILMDIRMPVLDGNETVKILRNHFWLQTPIIAITSDSIYEEEKSAQGFDGFITKPFEHKQMQNLLTELISLHRPEVKRIDFSHLTRQTQGDEGFANRMRDLFFSQLENITSDIQKHLKAGDINEIKQLVHKIKPSLRCMVSDSLYDYFVDFEQKSTEEDPYIPFALLYHLRKIVLENISK